MDWDAAQVSAMLISREKAEEFPNIDLRVRQAGGSATVDGLPRFCLGCTAEERPRRCLSTCRVIYTQRLGMDVRRALRLPELPASFNRAGETLNAAVRAGQSKLELRHPAGTAVVVL